MFKITLAYLDKLTLRRKIREQRGIIERQRMRIVELEAHVTRLEEYVADERPEYEKLRAEERSVRDQDPGGIR